MIKPNKFLFWFLKEKTELNLDNPSTLDMYVQQVVSRGKTADVKKLLKTVDLQKFQESLHRLNRFLSFEIRKFWEDYFGNPDFAAKRNP
jgi:glutaminase